MHTVVYCKGREVHCTTDPELVRSAVSSVKEEGGTFIFVAPLGQLTDEHQTAIVCDQIVAVGETECEA